MEELTAPGAVVDVTAKVASNCDYELTKQDILDWETRHGPLPKRALVCMKTGTGFYVLQYFKRVKARNFISLHRMG
jgi:hypothetical protein